jgi:hypothetical protein
MRLRTLALAVGLCACENVLSIEEATIDPALDRRDTMQDPCSRYCDLVAENCREQDAVYSSREGCLSLCASMPAGEPGVTSGHSVQCRLYAAELAPAEPSFYCPGAGPGGNGVCGDNCESFCQLVALVCTGENSGYGDEEQCRTDCYSLSDLGTFAISPAPRGPQLQCRLYHLTNATLEPDRHCSHALGASPCK